MRPNARMRIGGLVLTGSVQRADERHVTFAITDNQTEVKVTYTGLLPDLFREGQGVVAEGQLINGVFRADSVLAKHDEKYMPREVTDSLKQQGVWNDGSGKQEKK
jgi:cytochrome c-type biogenesis protein CcmE